MRSKIILLLALVLSFNGYANSTGSKGGECEPAKVDKKIDLDKRRGHVEEMTGNLLMYLEKNVEKMALISRAGSDISERNFKAPSKMKYTHAAIAVKLSAYNWRLVHLLNDCAGPTSSIYDQGLGLYLQDDPFNYDLLVEAPSLELQTQVLDLLTNEVEGKLVIDMEKARSYHHPKYSNVAHPFRTKYQNSNMWVLTILAAAQSGAQTRPEAQRFYEENGFIPSQVKPKWHERKFGSFFTENFKKDDHAKGAKWFNFVSADSLAIYLENTDSISKRATLCISKGCDLEVAKVDRKERKR